MTNDELAAANRAYNTTVSRLTQNPERRVSITVGDKTMTVTAGDVARGLIRADVRGGSGTGTANTLGGALTPGWGTSDGRPIITLERGAFSADPIGLQRQLGFTFVHEGIHTVPQEIVFSDIERARFNIMHQPPYWDAVRELYGNE